MYWYPKYWEMKQAGSFNLNTHTHTFSAETGDALYKHKHRYALTNPSLLKCL